ncbi:transposase [Streptococcus pseudopneumoniae]|nr:transposase [Streptococcus pseudopneumoniae]KPL39965.1 transposase [Streptococcus pseudopneumoniae]KPL44309.1 transposase [Streptococcus pseudopneumoniae]
MLYNSVEKTCVHIKKVLASCNTFLRVSFVLFLFQLTISPMVLVQKTRL